MLDLKPGIGLDETEEGLLAAGIDQELEGPEAAILHSLGHAYRRRHDLLAQFGGEPRARRHLDNLLVAPLDRAVAFAEGHDPALAVAHDLNLDVARAIDQPLGIERPVAEGGLGFRRAAFEGLGDLALLAHGAHAATAASRNRLDHDPGTGVLGEEGLHRRDVARPVGARQQWCAGLCRVSPCLGLVAEQLELVGSRPHEDQARVGASAREGRILRQEAVAGMDRVAARRLGRRDDAADIEIGGGALSLQGLCFVDPPDVQRGGVVLGIDTDRDDAEFGGGLGDADGDLAAIGDQEFLEHGPEYRVKRGRCRNAC